jgi:serine protease AprX
MKRTILLLGILIILSQIVFANVPSEPKRTPVISPMLEHVKTASTSVWVYFTDRGFHSESEYAIALQHAKDQLFPHARWRRAKVLGDQLVSYHDLSVNPEYIQSVLTTGAKRRTVSRYINAISVDATSEQIHAIANLPFVRAIDPVAKGRRNEPESNLNAPVNRHPLPPGTDQLDYGPSRDQLAQINVIHVHEAGYTGAKVLLCLLDTGYMLSHEAFDSLQIVATWDFINNDSIVTNQPGDPEEQDNHGTFTLSTAAGLSPGQLYGPAYHALILAGKTEIVDQEIPVEEDYYVAGLEWADSLGAEVVSTSLGYIDWYTWEDMNGNTAVTTIGVDIAVANGIVCVTANGNERQSEWGHLIAPADADSVIACGAVDIYGTLAGFSSPGPTYDGRTKPEVCACGLDTYCATPWQPNGYGYISGTSLSTPLVGGSAALILEAHPDWTPMMVREALMMTADNAQSPNNDYGWGIINVEAAINYQFESVPERGINRIPTPSALRIIGSYPNPFNSEVTLEYEIITPGNVTLEVYDLLGQTVEKRILGYQSEGIHNLQWNNVSSSSGLYFYHLSHPQASHWGRWVYMK